MRIGVLTSHPIQYQAPYFRALTKRADLHVFFAHRPTAEQQGSGFGRSFNWDVDLLSGYSYTFLRNKAKNPGTNSFFGCDTPEIKEVIRTGHFDAFIVSGWFLKSYWQAVRACKRLVQDLAGQPVTEALRADTARRIADVRASDEGKDGVQAFLNKRAPSWQSA